MRHKTKLFISFITFAVLVSLFLHQTTPYIKLKRVAAGLEDADKVELFLLQGDLSLSDGGVFFTELPNDNFATFGSASLSDDEIYDLIELLSSLRQRKDGSVLAHAPQYGIRASSGGNVFAEFAISWSCSNISIVSKVFGFSVIDYDSEFQRNQLQELLEVFNRKLPYNENYLKDAENAKQEFLRRIDAQE